MPEVQGGTLTFLFTDIEGSTRLVKELRSEYGDVLAEHRELLREAFRAHGGHEVDSQGDAFFVCFRRAKDAVAAAVAAQLALHAKQWPGDVDVRVRIGIHTGEAEAADGRYHGVAVHRAARIMAAAHGGQVLLSHTTRDLLEDEEEEAVGVTMRDLGVQRLKDLERPVHLYQLLIDGLPSDFPPPRTEADLGEAAEATLAPSPFYRRRTILVGALAGVIAAAIAIPIFALGSGGSAGAAVTPNSVVEIDPASGKVVKVIPVGTNPGPMTAGEGAVWVANLDDKTVSEIDPRTGARLADISTDTDAGPPTGIAAGLGSLWVSFGNSGRVDRIDPRSRAITKRLRVHEEIGLRNLFGRRALAVGAGSVWLANLDATVVRIGSDGRAHQKITVGGGHWPAIAVASDGSLWEAVENERSVWHVDPKTNSKYGVVGIGGQIEAIATSPGAVWVIDGQHGQVVRVDPASTAIAQKINVGSRPTAEVLAGSDLWVANSGSGTLSEIDVRRNKVIRTIPLGDRPSGITFASGRLWVSISRHLPASSAKRPPAQVLRLGIPTDYPGPDLIDPAAADNPNGNVLTWSILYATCAKLLNYPDKPGRAGLRPTPEVAMAMPTVADGGKTYTFTIRTGSHAFRFSPPWNTPVTAETFKASIERTLDPAMHSYATLQGLLDDVVGVKPYEKGKVNDIKGIEPSGATLTFRLTRPSQTFLARLSMPQFCAVPADFPRQIGLSQIPAAGPYYVAASSPEGIVLKENPNYHGGRPHHFKEIDFVQGVDAAAVQAGTADNVVVFPTDVQRLMKRFGPNSPAARNGHQRLFVDPVPATFLLVLNTARPLFRSRALRRAVSYAVDRQAFSAVEFGPIATPPFDHYLTPGFPGARTRRVYPPNGNLALARRLASGHGGQAVFYYLQEDPRGEAVIEKALKAIGIDVVRKLFAGSVALAKAQKRGAPFDVALSIPDADYPDPASVLGDLVSGRAIRRDINTNDAYFNSAVYNRKLAKAATLTGPRRLQAYGRLDLELARRESPYVALARWTFENFYSARIGCQVFSPVPHYDVDFAALCLRK